MARVFSRSRLRGTALSLLACGLLSACIFGGQTSGDSREPELCSAGEQDRKWEQQVAWDEKTYLQFSPEEARALVVGEHVATLSWDDANVAYGFEPEHGESQIVIDVAPPLALPKLITTCSERYLSFESTVTVSTVGGALLEQFQGTFTARYAHTVDLNAPLLLNGLTGSLTINAKGSAPPTYLHVRVTFRNSLVSGSLSASHGVQDSGGWFACWPSGNECGRSL